MMGAARTFGTSFDELGDGDGIVFSFAHPLQVKSESPTIIGNRIPLQFFPRPTTPHTHEARGIRGENHCSTLAQVSHVSHVSGGVRRAGRPQVSHVSHVSGGVRCLEGSA